MMRFQIKILFLPVLVGIGLGVGCTTSQTNSLDDEMLSEIEVTDEAFGEPAQNAGDVSLDLEEFDFSQVEPQQPIADEASDLGFDEFEFDESATASNDIESFSEDELAEELELDELSADEVVQTPEPPAFSDKPQQVDELDLADSFEEPVVDEFTMEEASPTPTVSGSVEITDIRYLANQAGGTVVVDADKTLNYETRFNAQNGQYIIEIQNAVLPERLKRPFLMKDFSGSFGSINAYQTPGDITVRIVVQLKPGFNEEPALRMEGTSLVVVPPSFSAENFAAVQDNSAPSPPQGSSSAPLGAGTLEEFLMSNQKFEGRPISLQVRDADVRDVISFISEESGANIVMSDQVDGKISMKLRRVPWDQALVSVMRAKNLGYIRHGNVLRISTMGELRAEAQHARDFLIAQKELAPIKVKVIPVNYANVDSLENQVKEFLSKEGKVVVDARSNSILITDREDILDKVTKLIAALDIQPNQVLIEGKIVEASEDFTSSLGIRWGATGSPITLSQTGGALGTPLELSPRLNFAQGGSPLPNFVELTFGKLDFLGDLNAALHLAESDRTAKLISSPRIVVMNRDRAEIGQSSEVISLVTIPSGGSGSGSFFLNQTENRIPVQLKLAVTPQITSDGSVIMDIDVLRQFAGPVVAQTTQSRPVNSRTAKTRVLVRNGETSVIGGIYQTDETQSDIGVPVLKDIPILGWLFKSREKEKIKNELLIFLTPRIMVNGQDTRAASL